MKQNIILAAIIVMFAATAVAQPAQAKRSDYQSPAIAYTASPCGSDGRWCQPEAGTTVRAKRSAVRHRGAKRHKTTHDANGNVAAPAVEQLSFIDEEAKAWLKPITVAKGYIQSRKTGERGSIDPRYQAQFQALADDLEAWSPQSKIFYMGGYRPGHCSPRHQHSCWQAIDFCQDSRGRISGEQNCHLPPPEEFHKLVVKHHLHDGSVWCDGDYGHVQARNSGGCNIAAHGWAAGHYFASITGKVEQASAKTHVKRRYAYHRHRHTRMAAR